MALTLMNYAKLHIHNNNLFIWGAERRGSFYFRLWSAKRRNTVKPNTPFSSEYKDNFPYKKNYVLFNKSPPLSPHFPSYIKHNRNNIFIDSAAGIIYYQKVLKVALSFSLNNRNRGAVNISLTHTHTSHTPHMANSE